LSHFHRIKSAHFMTNLKYKSLNGTQFLQTITIENNDNAL
jgi:hypothetical protein